MQNVVSRGANYPRMSKSVIFQTRHDAKFKNKMGMTICIPTTCENGLTRRAPSNFYD